MGEEMIIDRELLKAIGADARISILKSLSEHQKTQSDLAKELKLSSPTIFEHVGQLLSAGLVEKLEEGRKWKYYALTEKGKRLISSSKKGTTINTIIILGIVLLFALFILKGPYFYDQTPTADSGGTFEISEYGTLDGSGLESSAYKEEAGAYPGLQAMKNDTNTTNSTN